MPKQPLNLAVSALEPVGGPYPVDLPAEVFEDFLAKAVSITRGAAGVITRAIAFDAEQECSGLGRMLDAEIDEETRDAHLRHNLVAVFLEDGSHGALEVVRGLVAAVVRLLQDAGAGKDQILLQRPDAPRAIGGRLDAFGIERAEDDDSLLGAREKAR